MKVIKAGEKNSRVAIFLPADRKDIEQGGPEDVVNRNTDGRHPQGD